MNGHHLETPAWLAAVMAESGDAAIEEALQQHPERLEEIAVLIGLHALAPAVVLAAECDFDAVPLPVVLDKKLLPVRVDGVLYLIIGRPGSIALRNWSQRLCDELDARLTSFALSRKTPADQVLAIELKLSLQENAAGKEGK